MDWFIIALAGFIGGLLNAIAGGGSFITLPALIFVGVPPVIANATGTAALLPGYIASAWRFRKDIELPANFSFFQLTILAIAGGIVGALILLMSGERLFSQLIPWLILFATLAFIIGPSLIKSHPIEHNTTGKQTQESWSYRASVTFILLCTSVYGGYFNGGLGIIILAVLGFIGQTNLHGMNGLKNILSAILTAVAVCVYIIGGSISLKYLMLLGGAAVIGGYIGASVAYRLSQIHLRYFIVTIGLFMSVVFFYKQG
ncbi:sulfite exporter TauE/SafE family protein [Thalassotalea profundi]|uniref:Probable membrane transporter protein n=1 Tax=Thalassotalea profundi TaxID=2036687 RepID=A0ABQ3J1B9_9GAMM|nr:sulfite exporter TauE/SafE family protein [Thalassotalea profundi]GHE95741.1 UPF0721 transmembrane protein [Thalassotalea profundi]